MIKGKNMTQESSDDLFLALLSINSTLKWVQEQNSTIDTQLLTQLFNRALLKYNRLTRGKVTENVSNRLRLYNDNLGKHMKDGSSLLNTTESNVSKR
jgi:hypothetical protein